MIDKKLLQFFEDREVMITTPKLNYRGKLVKVFNDFIAMKSKEHEIYINQEHIISIEGYSKDEEIYQEKTT